MTQSLSAQVRSEISRRRASDLVMLQFYFLDDGGAQVGLEHSVPDALSHAQMLDESDPGRATRVIGALDPNRIGYPHRGPRTSEILWRDTGWTGWRPSAKHDSALFYSLNHLWEFLEPRGWEMQTSVYVARANSGSAAVAKLGLAVNGSESAYSRLTCRSFGDTPEEHRRWYGLRIFGDELGLDREPRSPGPCVSEMIRRLAKHVDDLIEHFSRVDLRIYEDDGWERLSAHRKESRA